MDAMAMRFVVMLLTTAVAVGCGRIVDLRKLSPSEEEQHTTDEGGDGDTDDGDDGDAPPPRRPFDVGFHFHAHPGERENGPVLARYNIVRLSDYGDLLYMPWWTGVGTYDWGALDDWVDYHAANGARGILVLEGVPRWASSDPNAANPAFPGRPGCNQPIAPAYVGAYGDMIRATLGRYGGFWAAVEGWSQALPGSERYGGTATQLADMQSYVYQSVKSLSSGIPVMSPAVPEPLSANAPIVLGATTSGGDPIRIYFDWVAYHPFTAFGDEGGPAGHGDFRARHDLMVAFMQDNWGAARPLYASWWGVYNGGGPSIGYCELTSQQKADALYGLYATAYALGEKGLVLYSYDNNDTSDGCRSINTCTAGEPSESGFETFTYDGVVAAGVSRATDDFGAP